MSWVLDDLEHNLPLLDLVKYGGVLSFTLVWLELLATFEDEVRYIWPSRWSVMKAIFFLNRYSPVVDATLNVTLGLFTRDPKACEIQFIILASSYVTGSLASEAILMARTMALYDFSFVVTSIMVAAGLGILIPSIIVCHSFIIGLVYPPAETLRIIGGCLPTIEDRPVWVLYMCLIISETVVVLLTFYKMRQTSSDKTHRSPLVRTMYRDGSLYYVVLLVFSIANLCFMLLAPKAASSVIQMPLRVIHSTLCSRVLLNLRKVAAKQTDVSFDEYRPRSGIAFDPRARENHVAMSYMDLELDTLDDDYRYR